MSDSELNLIGAALILIAAIIPLYLSFKLQGKIRLLTLALAVFCLVHSTYHFALAIGMDYLGNNILEPASVLSLLAFGGIYVSYVKMKREVHSK